MGHGESVHRKNKLVTLTILYVTNGIEVHCSGSEGCYSEKNTYMRYKSVLSSAEQYW